MKYLGFFKLKLTFALLFLVMVNTYTLNAQLSDYQQSIARSRADFSMGNYSRAEDILRSGMVQPNFDPDVALLLGDILVKRERYDEAFDEYQTASLAGAQDANFRIAKLAASIGKTDVAVAYLKKDFDSKQRTLPFYINSDNAFEAIRANAQFIEFQKYAQYSIYELRASDALYANYAGNTSEAFSVINALISKNPKKHQAYNIRGDFHFADKNYKAAFENYEKASELAPKNLNYIEKQANTLFFLGKYKQAYAQYLHVLEQKPYKTELYKPMAKCKLNMSDNEQAMKDIGTYLSYYNNETEAVSIAAQTEVATENYHDALIRANYLVQSVPNFEHYQLRGDIRSQMNLHTDAFADFAQCLDLQPNNGEMWYKAGMALQNAGDKEKACVYFSKAVSYGYYIASDYMQDCR